MPTYKLSFTVVYAMKYSKQDCNGVAGECVNMASVHRNYALFARQRLKVEAENNQVIGMQMNEYVQENPAIV